MSGSASSLNVSVAASIAIYEVIRQRTVAFVQLDQQVAASVRPKTVGSD